MTGSRLSTKKISGKLRGFVVKHLLLLCHYFFLIPFQPLIRKKHLFLSHWLDFSIYTEKQSLINRLLFRIVFKNWTEQEYLREPNPDRREEMKSIAMGGTNSSDWAAYYDNRTLDLTTRVGSLDSQEALPVLAYVEAACVRDRPDKVIQIGSSSGREIAYFASKFPGMSCVGTDVYPEVVEYSQKRHVLGNLSFILCSAHRVFEFPNLHQNQEILVFSSGSFQYVQPEHVRIFFERLANFSNRSVTIMIGEPANEIAGDPDGLCDSAWRGNFSYTHDYRYYSEKAGLKTTKSEIIRPNSLYYEKFPKALGTVHYLYIAATLHRRG